MAASTARRSGRHSRANSDSLHATRAETRRYYREVGASDPHRAAYEAGKSNADRPGPEEPDSVHEAYNQGQADAHAARQRKTPQGAKPGSPKQSATAATASPAGGPIVSSETAHQGAGFLLGLVAYALTVSYLDYGWPGVTGWFSAKFLNKVTITGPGSHAFNLTASGNSSTVTL